MPEYGTRLFAGIEARWLRTTMRGSRQCAVVFSETIRLVYHPSRDRPEAIGQWAQALRAAETTQVSRGGEAL